MVTVKVGSSTTFLGAMSAAGISVADDSHLLRSFASDASGRHGATPVGLVRPSSASQLQQVVRGAGASGVRLIPVSSPSGPRRRGDTVSDTPVVIVDMSGMARILHVDGDDAIALIEAGVTFPQFAAALKPHGLRPFQPLMPRASKSVVAAFLEREPTTVPGKHWDSSDPIATMEVVFGTGDLFRTGSASMPGTLKENLADGNRQMFSLGPSHTDFGRVLQGAQGSLGIVTWASIFCQRIPALELHMYASSDRLEALIELCYTLLRRRTNGQLFIVNNVQLALMLAGDAAEYARLKALLPRWVLYVELTAPAYFPEESMAYQRKLLEDDAARLGVDLSSTIAGHTASDLPARQQAYSDRSSADRAGLADQEVFCLSQLDRAPSHISAMDGLVADGNCAIYLQPMVHGVNAHCQFTFLDAPDNAERLAGVARRAADLCADTGGFFSRPYHPWADVPFARDPSARPLLARAKGIFDPKHILQPGALALGETA